MLLLPEKSRQHEENKEQESFAQEAKKQMEDVGKTVQSATEKTFDGLPVEEEERQTGVLGAIGETILEIAQITEELVIGPFVDR